MSPHLHRQRHPRWPVLSARPAGTRSNRATSTCSKCLVKAPSTPAATPAANQPPAPVYPAPAPVYQAPPPPPPQYAAPPAPAAAPAVAGLVCKACGNPIKPGDKSCSKCLVKVPTSPAPAPLYQAPPPPASQPLPPPAAGPAPGGYVCSSCGSPVSGSEKFCGICGSPVVAAKPPAPTSGPSGTPGRKVLRELRCRDIRYNKILRQLRRSSQYRTPPVVVTLPFGPAPR